MVTENEKLRVAKAACESLAQTLSKVPTSMFKSMLQEVNNMESLLRGLKKCKVIEFGRWERNETDVILILLRYFDVQLRVLSS